MRTPNIFLSFLLLAAVGLVLLRATSTDPGTNRAGWKGVDVSGLQPIHGEPDFSRAKLVLAEFWAVW